MAFDFDVPLAANQIAVDIVTMNANWEYVISGDGTAGRVLRRSRLVIDDGTNATTLKCTLTSLWNGDAISVTDNIALNATTGNFTLDAAGNILDIEAAGLSGNCITTLGGNIYSNTSNVPLHLYTRGSSNKLRVIVTHAQTGGSQVLTTLVDTGSFDIDLTYLTDA